MKTTISLSLDDNLVARIVAQASREGTNVDALVENLLNNTIEPKSQTKKHLLFENIAKLPSGKSYCNEMSDNYKAEISQLRTERYR